MREDPMSRRIREHFDLLAEGEWARLEDWPAGRVSFAVHQRFLEDHVRPGDRVLEIGAGPGRFTLELARLGARVVVTDVSVVQLELNADNVERLGAEFAVEERRVLDVRDAREFEAGSFDVVTAFGGPLSYVFEDAPAALDGLLGLVRPGRPVLASVMSHLGAWRTFLGGVVDETDTYGEEVMAEAIRTGDLRSVQPTGHVCQLYRWSALRTLVESCGAEVVAASASNWASLADQSVVERIMADSDRWARFVEQEIAACREPGALDGGTHLLIAAVRQADPAPSA